jgi:hypothetical protein
MPEIAVPCDTVPQAAVPVPRKTPVPEGWKLAECCIVSRGGCCCFDYRFDDLDFRDALDGLDDNCRLHEHDHGRGDH